VEKRLCEGYSTPRNNLHAATGKLPGDLLIGTSHGIDLKPTSGVTDCRKQSTCAVARWLSAGGFLVKPLLISVGGFAR
jgi:hypothetical protein